MSLEVRAAAEHDLTAIARCAASAFGWAPLDGVRRELWEGIYELDRALVTTEGGEVVATAGAFSFRMSAPGGDLPTAGVTLVAVSPTHRRRGLMRALMRRQLDDAHARGEPLAALFASEGSIYGRYGYGPATYDARLTVELPGLAFTGSLGEREPVRLVEAEEHRAELADVYERARRLRWGMMSRSDALWNRVLREPTGTDENRFMAVIPSKDGIDGFAFYRTRLAFDDAARPDSTVEVTELAAATPSAEAALWRHCLGRDLTRRVDAPLRPVDELLPLLLADPHRLRTVVRHGIWLRLVDVRRALGDRTYATAAALTLDVHDAFCPWNSGRLRLEGGPDGAVCVATSARPDIVLDAADLAAAYLGANTFTRLVLAGRAVERRSGALARADALFSAPRAPWCSRNF